MSRRQTIFNKYTQRYEVAIDGVVWQTWLNGYCGRLLSNPDKTKSNTVMVEMNDGTLVTDLESVDEYKWMIGHYYRNHRIGKKPNRPDLVSLASRNDIRPAMRDGREY